MFVDCIGLNDFEVMNVLLIWMGFEGIRLKFKYNKEIHYIAGVFIFVFRVGPEKVINESNQIFIFIVNLGLLSIQSKQTSETSNSKFTIFFINLFSFRLMSLKKILIFLLHKKKTNSRRGFSFHPSFFASILVIIYHIIFFP